MTLNSFNLVEIADLNDGLLLPWLDLYETAFPPNERELVSSKLDLLKAKMRGDAEEETMLAAVVEQQTLIGIVDYEVNQALSVALLWYFAVKRELRGKGLGSQIYRELIAQLAAKGIRTLIVEVEMPEEAESKEKYRWAERRIAFYRRLGAKLLTGVHYMQDVGWHQPPTPMHIMVHPLQPLDAQSAYDLAKAIFEDAIEQTGPLALSEFEASVKE